MAQVGQCRTRFLRFIFIFEDNLKAIDPADFLRSTFKRHRRLSIQSIGMVLHGSHFHPLAFGVIEWGGNDSGGEKLTAAIVFEYIQSAAIVR